MLVVLVGRWVGGWGVGEGGTCPRRSSETLTSDGGVASAASESVNCGMSCFEAEREEKEKSRVAFQRVFEKRRDEDGQILTFPKCFPSTRLDLNLFLIETFSSISIIFVNHS